MSQLERDSQAYTTKTDLQTANPGIKHEMNKENKLSSDELASDHQNAMEGSQKETPYDSSIKTEEQDMVGNSTRSEVNRKDKLTIVQPRKQSPDQNDLINPHEKSHQDPELEPDVAHRIQDQVDGNTFLTLLDSEASLMKQSLANNNSSSKLTSSNPLTENLHALNVVNPLDDPKLEINLNQRHSIQKEEVDYNLGHLSPLKPEKDVNSESKKLINNSLDQKILLQISSKHKNNLSSLAENKLPRDKWEIEDMVRNEKLQKVQRSKFELEEHLRGIEETLRELNQQSLKTSPRERRNDSLSKEKDAVLAQEAEKFVRQLQWQRRQKELRDEQKMKLLQSHLQSEFERIQNIRKSGRLQSLDLGKRLNSVSDEQQSYNFANQNQSFRYVRNIQARPLYKVMEKRYEEKILFPEFEKRKRILSMRHQNFKPLENNAFQLFQEQYKQEKLKYEIPKHREQQEEKLSHPRPKKHHSNTLQQVIESDEMQKNEEMIKLEEKKKLYQKKVQYGRAIKEIYFPTIVRNPETKLRQDALQAIEKLRKIKDINIIEQETNRFRFDKPRFRSDVGERPLFPQDNRGSKSPDPSDFKIRPKPKNKEVEASQHFEARTDSIGVIKKAEVGTRKQKQHSAFDSSIDTSKRPKPLQNEQFTLENSSKNYPNYLEGLKRERRAAEKEQKTKINKQQAWNRYLKDQNLSCAEKITYVLNDAKILESKAKLKYDRLLRRSANISLERTNEEEETIDELFVSAIKAKLALLGEINEAENLNNKTTL